MPERFPSRSKKEKKGELESKIDFKIRKINEIRDLADNCANLSLEDIKKQFEEKFKSVKNEFNEETLIKFEQHQGLILESEKVEAEQLDITDAYYENIEKLSYKNIEKLSSDAQKKWLELSDKELDIKKAIDDALRNNDVLFLKKIRDFFDGLIKKREQVLKWQKKYEQDHSASKYKFYKSFTNSLPEEFRTLLPYQIISINFNGYNIDIVLTSEIFESHLGLTMQGVHIHDIVVNLIKHNVNTQESHNTINHEHNHNILETFMNNPKQVGKYFINLIRRRLQRFYRCIQINAMQSIINYEKKLLKDGIQNYYMVNECEVIADIDNIFDSPLNAVPRSYSTDMQRTIILLEDFIEKEVKDDFGIKKLMEDALEYLRNKFAQCIDDIMIIFSNTIDRDIKNETKAALILFGLNRLDRVKKYQEYMLNKKHSETSL